jgi:hypothetical protein
MTCLFRRVSDDKDTMAEVWDDDAACQYEMGRIEGVTVHAVLGRYVANARAN